VAGLDFKSSCGLPEGRLGGFDSHAPPPFLSNAPAVLELQKPAYQSEAELLVEIAYSLITWAFSDLALDDRIPAQVDLDVDILVGDNDAAFHPRTIADPDLQAPVIKRAVPAIDDDVSADYAFFPQQDIAVDRG